MPLCQVHSTPCGTKEPKELFLLPYRVKAPRLKSKAALQVFQNSLKLPLKERPLDRLLASFPQSVPLPLKKEGVESIDTCVWVHVFSCTQVYINKDQRGTLAALLYRRPLSFMRTWGSVRFVGDLHSLFMEMETHLPTERDGV